MCKYLIFTHQKTSAYYNILNMSNAKLGSQVRSLVSNDANSSVKIYYSNVDLFKGLLLLLVIAGHLLLGSISGHLSKFVIYSFHMPLFIAISGYLSNADRLRQTSLASLINKYLFRLIIPWLITLGIYFVIIYYPHYSVHNLILMIAFYPFWYVPGLLFYILLTWLLLKINVNFKIIVTLALIASACTFPFNALVDAQHAPEVYFPFKVILEGLKPNYYIFFVWAMYLQNTKDFKKAQVLGLIGFAALLFATDTYSFYQKNIFLLISTFYGLNMCLIFLMIGAANKTFFPVVKPIEWLGKNSLGIYLWHALPLILLTVALDAGKFSLLTYFLLAVLAECLVVLAVFAGSRVQIIKKYLLGMV